MWYVFNKNSCNIYGKYYLLPDAEKKCRKLNRTTYSKSQYAIEEVEEGTPVHKVKMWLLLKQQTGFVV